MDQSMLQQINSLRKDFPQIDGLMKKHQTLDEMVAQLTEKAFLSPEEDLEMHEMKKEKLKIKDELEALILSKKSA